MPYLVIFREKFEDTILKIDTSNINSSICKVSFKNENP